MANMKTLMERYVEAFRSIDDEERLKSELASCMLKDEMLEFCKNNGVEVDNKWTKNEIAEKLISPEIFENITGKREKKEKEVKPTIDSPEEKTTSTAVEKDMLGTGSMYRSWRTLYRGIEDNLRRYLDGSMEHWKSMEEQWVSRAGDFQDQIEDLGGQGVPLEEYKDISVLWRNFLNKMSARFFRTSSNLKELNENLADILEKYDKKVREEFDEEGIKIDDVGAYYSLWMEINREISEEVNKIGKSMSLDYEILSDTWERFSKKTRDMLDDYRNKQGKQSEDLYKSWNEIFSDINTQLYDGIGDSRDWYGEIWKNVGDQSTKFIDSMTQGFREMEENYSKILSGTFDVFRRAYTDPFGMNKPSKSIESEMDELRKRIVELEEKLE